MTNLLFIVFYLMKSWRSNCLERGNGFVSRTKLSNLLQCKIIKYYLIGAESLSISKIYLILVCWVKWEGHAFKLKEQAWLLWVAHTSYCNMQAHDAEIIERISAEILQSLFNSPFVIIFVFQLAIIGFSSVLPPKCYNVS